MLLNKLIFLLALLVCWGCSDVSVPDAKSTTGRLPLVAEVPGPEETVRGVEDPPIVTLEIPTALQERRLSRAQELPGEIIVPNTNLKGVPVTAALQAVLEGTDVSLSWDSNSFEDRLVTVTNLSGPLPVVVEKICASAKVFCGYRRGLLEMKEKETFIIELPTVPGKAATNAASNTMAETISKLSGEQAQIDQQGGNLLYTTDVDGYEHVHEYLSQLRHGRPLVVMQLYIWEVTLNKDKGTGINWSSFSLDKIGHTTENAILSGTTAFSSLSSPGVSLGATFAGKVDAKAVLAFLATQGQVQTISNPQLTFVSGSNAEFRVGGQQRYISEVGNSTSSVSSSTTSTSSNTVSTDSIDTGLTVAVNGSYESGVITAALELELQDIISLNETTTESGVTIDLPETTERKVSTSLRVRPGDNLVLAGLVTSRDSNTREGVPLFGSTLPAYSNDELKNTELVILVKPSIVKFTEPDPAQKAKKEIKEKEEAEKELPPPEAYVIDKDGVKVVALPETPNLDTAAAARANANGTAAPEEVYAPPMKVSVASGDQALVDKKLMQRGFSYAYEELNSAAPENK